MNCSEAIRRLEPLKKEFAVRFYHWAEQELRRELDSDFARVRKVKSGRVFHFLEFMASLSQRERRTAAFAILRAAITHRLACQMLGIQLSVAEKAYIEEYGRRFYPVAYWSELEEKLRAESPPEEFKIDKDEFEDLLVNRISQALGAEPIPKMGCCFQQQFGRWYLQTGFDVHNIFQLQYAHYIQPRGTLKPTDYCPLLLYDGRISFLGWLGVDPATHFNLLRRSEVEETAVFIAEVTKQFVSQLPTLLAGLTHDIPEQLEITKTPSSDGQSKRRQKESRMKLVRKRKNSD